MSLGLHSFYVFPRTHNLVDNHADYFIGSFIGDHFNDEVFAEKLRRIEQKIQSKFGWRCTYFWSPGIAKPYKPLTEDQKYKRAITKATNIHKKKSLQIIQDNTLFTNDFLYEEINRHHERVEVLKKRYNQAKADF
ncbi:MAG: hypothetical protein V4450_17365 [Bacteroidota bacterium]